jgi:hypothetical protein
MTSGYSHLNAFGDAFNPDAFQDLPRQLFYISPRRLRRMMRPVFSSALVRFIHPATLGDKVRQANTSGCFFHSSHVVVGSLGYFFNKRFSPLALSFALESHAPWPNLETA